ncbi:cytochrome c/c1 heme lyase-domain-containing protein [Pavlovales sp. CCMP2436]|nr:cytochrome c/c1 heme lyase-domain-containing protein [Pavlovales sp. CCMP2436]
MGQGFSAGAKPPDAPQVAASGGGCPLRISGLQATTAALQGGVCPVKGAARAPADAGAPLDPKNMMPAANQMPAEGQTRVLPTTRVESTIPQADGSTRWVYPSPQMFFNALTRKGKATTDEEEHMEAVVAIHNNMNERTWNAVLEWEKRHANVCEYPTLARFMGRPDDLSAEARVRYWTTGQLPFDRHDWFVNRCGKEVRYIIDYYDLVDKQEADKVPTLHDATSMQSIELVVR